jgi:hypothetical protein
VQRAQERMGDEGRSTGERIPIGGGDGLDADIVAHGDGDGRSTYRRAKSVRHPCASPDSRVRGHRRQASRCRADAPARAQRGPCEANGKFGAMHIAIAQLNQVLGDLRGNGAAILAATGEAGRAGARLVVTPELSLCGYPPEDLVLRPAFLDACARELASLASGVRGTPVVVGFPERDGGARYNSLAVLADGRVTAVYRKQQLPNYTVFDEERYFEPGTTRACSMSTARR